MERYWGIYCPQHGCWKRNHDGKLYFYPAPEIAKAHIEADGYDAPSPPYPQHLWEATEYGKEQRVDPKALPDGSRICPIEPHVFYSQGFKHENVSSEMSDIAGWPGADRYFSET